MSISGAIAAKPVGIARSRAWEALVPAVSVIAVPMSSAAGHTVAHRPMQNAGATRLDYR